MNCNDNNNNNNNPSLSYFSFAQIFISLAVLSVYSVAAETQKLEEPAAAEQVAEKVTEQDAARVKKHAYIAAPAREYNMNNIYTRIKHEN